MVFAAEILVNLVSFVQLCLSDKCETDLDYVVHDPPTQPGPSSPAPRQAQLAFAIIRASNSIQHASVIKTSSIRSRSPRPFIAF
jgi:hypothetical protein